MALYLAIHLGTTGCRSILFDENLRQLSSSYEEYGLITRDSKYIEQDAELWWELTLKTAKSAIVASGMAPNEIVGISVSSQGISLVPVNKNCIPLCNAISWLDTRAEAEAEQIRTDIGEEKLRAMTGKPCDAVYTLPKLLWLKKHMPDVYRKAYKLLMPLDFLTAKLTGNFVTDHSMASGTLMYDISGAYWSKNILAKYDIDINKLPELAYTGTAAGYVLPEIRQILGLKDDCIVAVGAQDQKSAALGAGLSEDTVTVSLGTAAAVIMMCQSPVYNIRADVSLCAYTARGKWVAEGVVATAGTCLRWVRDTFYKDDGYDALNDEAENAVNGRSRLMFTPYMSGGDTDRKGMFYNVSLSTQRGDFAAAVMEGVAFELRRILEEMDAYKCSKKLVLFGGGAKSDLWCRIIADVTQLCILVPETSEAASAGAAIAAATAAGKVLPTLVCKKEYTPGRDYEDKYNRYIRLCRKLWEEWAS